MVDRDDVEVGDEPVDVERRPRAGVVVSVRLSPEEAERLLRLAEARGTTLSQVTREAVASYLRAGALASASGVRWTGTTTDFASLTISTDAGPALGTSGGARQTPVPEHASTPAGGGGG